MRFFASLIILSLIAIPYVLFLIALANRVPGEMRDYTIGIEWLFTASLFIMNVDAIMAFIKAHF